MQRNRVFTGSSVANWIGAYPISRQNAARATGGTVSQKNGWQWHVFNDTGTLSVSKPGRAVVLIVGGGGGGGGRMSGGGGGGMVIERTMSLSVGDLTATIGGGGTGQVGANPPTGSPTAGSNSSFNSVTAYGGGKPGYESATAAVSDGPNGGLSGNSTTIVYSNYAPRGGIGNTANNSSGGGGSSSAIGSAGGTNGGAGADGPVSFITATATNYGGGGGGGGWSGNVGGAGGAGGGGKGGTTDTVAPVSGTANTGGGAGGHAYGAGQAVAANGGKGVVIVGYPL